MRKPTSMVLRAKARGLIPECEKIDRLGLLSHMNISHKSENQTTGRVESDKVSTLTHFSKQVWDDKLQWFLKSGIWTLAIAVIVYYKQTCQSYQSIVRAWISCCVCSDVRLLTCERDSTLQLSTTSTLPSIAFSPLMPFKNFNPSRAPSASSWHVERYSDRIPQL